MMMKWIGGAAAAAVMVFGAATLASDLLDEDTQRLEAEAVTLDNSIPVNEAAIAGDSDSGAIDATDSEIEFVSDPDVQDISEAMKAADAKPAVKPKKKAKGDAFVVKRIMDIPGPLKYGEWHWDDEGVPPGPLVMTVDLDARVLSVFRGGYEIGTTAVLLGTQKHPTPLGTFPILTKEKDNISEKYNNAPMPFTLRLTWDGIAIHGSDVENGFASHGCVGAPNDFAEKLFAIAKKGDKVVITRGEMIGMGDPII